MMKLLLILVSTLVFTACATTEEIKSKLTSSFLGKNIDDFVLRYGPPANRHTLNSGDVVYTWHSGVKSIAIPATTTFQANRVGPGVTGVAQTFGGGSIDLYCEVQIVTSPNGIIKYISPTKDTVGEWNLSRCAEIFK